MYKNGRENKEERNRGNFSEELSSEKPTEPVGDVDIWL